MTVKFKEYSYSTQFLGIFIASVFFYFRNSLVFSTGAGERTRTSTGILPQESESDLRNFTLAKITLLISKNTNASMYLNVIRLIMLGTLHPIKKRLRAVSYFKALLRFYSLFDSKGLGHQWHGLGT